VSVDPRPRQIKIVGRRRPVRGGLVAAAPLLDLVVELRGKMKAACGIEYDEASRSTDTVTIEGVSIPFASAHR
jgi:hypothetical protein